MPELPEVLITAGKLKFLTNAKIVFIKSEQINNYIYMNYKPTNLYIASIFSVGKIIYIDTTKKLYEIHLGLTGRVLLSRSKIISPFTRACIKLQINKEIIYVNLIDERAFGYIRTVDCPHEHDFMTMKRTQFITNIMNTKSTIYSALINQKISRGVGSYIAHESLYKAGMSPLKRNLNEREALRLYNCIKSIIKISIHNNGNSWDNFIYPDGTVGHFYVKLNVYGKRNKPCFKCKNKYTFTRICGKGVTFCSTCQT
jgi:formamidopyrimidine-DNA glycosylase